MEKLIKEFLNHLFDIGLINVTSAKDFISLYSKALEDNDELLTCEKSAPTESENDTSVRSTHELKLKEILSKTIVRYLSTMNEERKKHVSLSLVDKFIEMKAFERKNIAKKIFFVFSRFQKYKLRMDFLRSFQHWKKLLNISGFSNFLSMSFQSDKKMNINSISEQSKIMSKHPLETSINKKEQEELRHCTFHPQINKTSEEFRNKTDADITVHERLYRDHKKYLEKKEMRTIQREFQAGEKLSFSPKLIPACASPKSITSPSPALGFLQRQSMFQQSKSKHKERIANDIEEEASQVYTFSPTMIKRTNNSMSFSQSCASPKSGSGVNKSAYLRLYEDNNRRKQNYIKRQNEIKEEISSLSNGNIKSFSENNNNTGVDYRKIEELYNDYKNKKIRRNQLLQEIEIEQGLTFKPENYTAVSGEKYNSKICSNIHDRGKKLIEEKTKFVEVCNQIAEENLKIQKIGYEKYHRESKAEITKDIIDRLYVKGLEKTRARNSQEDIYEKEALRFDKYVQRGTSPVKSEGKTYNLPRQSNECNESNPVNDNNNNNNNHLQEDIPQPAYLAYKNQDNNNKGNKIKNFTFKTTSSNSSKETSNKESHAQAQNYNDKLISVENYGGVKSNKKGNAINIIDKNYRYKFDHGLKSEDIRPQVPVQSDTNEEPELKADADADADVDVDADEELNVQEEAIRPKKKLIVESLENSDQLEEAHSYKNLANMDRRVSDIYNIDQEVLGGDGHSPRYESPTATVPYRSTGKFINSQPLRHSSSGELNINQEENLNSFRFKK